MTVMTRTAIVLGLLLLTTTAAVAQDRDGWPTHLAIGTYMTLHGSDLALSSYLIGARQAREINPVLAPFADKPVVFGAAKMGIASTTGYLLLRMHRDHPQRAFWLALAGNVLYASVVVHNTRLIGQGRTHEP